MSLPLKTTSFKHWAEALTEHSGSLRPELAYWQAMAAPSPIPPDQESSAEIDTEGSARYVQVELSRDETQSLLKDVPSAYHTQISEVMLVGLVLSVRPNSSPSSLTVHMEGHGREEVIDGVDVSRTGGGIFLSSRRTSGSGWR